jgi:hypothetical protein
MECEAFEPDSTDEGMLLNVCLTCGEGIERHRQWPEDVHPFTESEINVIALAIYHAGPMARTKRNYQLYDRLYAKVKALASEWP